MSQLYARILMSCARYHVTMAAAPGHHPTAPTAPQFLFLLPPALPLLPPTSAPCPYNISRTTYLAEQLLVILRLANSGSCKGGMKYVFLFPAFLGIRSAVAVFCPSSISSRQQGAGCWRCDRAATCQRDFVIFHSSPV